MSKVIIVINKRLYPIMLAGTEKSGWWGPHPNQYGEGKGKSPDRKAQSIKDPSTWSNRKKAAVAGLTVVAGTVGGALVYTAMTKTSPTEAQQALEDLYTGAEISRIEERFYPEIVSFTAKDWKWDEKEGMYVLTAPPKKLTMMDFIFRQGKIEALIDDGLARKNLSGKLLGKVLYKTTEWHANAVLNKLQLKQHLLEDTPKGDKARGLHALVHRHLVESVLRPKSFKHPLPKAVEQALH